MDGFLEGVEEDGPEIIFSDLLALIPDATIVADGSGKIVCSNALTESMFGYDLDELIGQPVDILLPQDVRTGHWRHLQSFFSKPTARQMGHGLDLRAVKKTGEEFNVVIALNPVDRNGKMYAVASIRDTTERKQFEAKLRDAQLQLENDKAILDAVIETVPDLVFMKDESGKYILSNKAHRDFIGGQLAKDKTDEDLFGQDAAIAITENDLSVLRSGETHLFEEQVPDSTGDNKTFESVKVPIRIALTGLTGVLGVSRDVTERRALERKIEQDQKKFRTLFESNRDAAAIMDSSTFLDCNDKLVELFGCGSRSEIIGHSPLEYSPQKMQDGKPSRQFAEQVIQEALDKGSALFEWQHVRKDGVCFPAEVMLSRVDIDGQPCLYALIRDISARVRNEQELQRAIEEAEIANASKSTFLAKMSHEIRSPMNGVIANLELLSHSVLTDDQKELLSSAEISANTLLGIIGDILDFSKIEAGAIELENIEFSPLRVMQEIETILRPRAASRDVGLTVSTDGRVPERVFGDPLRLKQVLLNIGGNATKFVSSGGGIHLHIHAPEVDQHDCLLRFEIHDSGIGLPRLGNDHIFDSFKQEDDSTTRKYGGSGLGMSISKGIVDLWGGEIDFDGVKGGGTTFWFSMPARVVKEAPRIKPVDLSDIQVVLITGNEEHSRDFLEYLESRNANLTTVSSGKDGLSLCRKLCGGENAVFVFVDEANTDKLGDRLGQELLNTGAYPILRLREPGSIHLRMALNAGYRHVIQPHLNRAAVDRTLQEFVLARSAEGDGNGLFAKEEEIEWSAQFEGRHVLVVEDRPMNQTVAKRQLAKLGLTCDIASNGLEGLDALDQSRYDLVLCDCMMPKMDGFQFTKAVREKERRADQEELSRLPVVAMTANAFTEDIEKCRAAGMDDFISKPVTLSHLSAVLKKWLKVNSMDTDSAEQESLAPSITSDPVDLKFLSEIMGSDDSDLLWEVLGDFIEEAKKSLDEVKEAAASRDADTLKTVAHGAKGEARNAGASLLGEHYYALELLAKVNDLNEIQSVLIDIEAEFERTVDFIRHRKS